MLWSTLFGSMLAVFLIASDVLLLKLKLRALPTGSRAWLSSCLSPFAVGIVASLPVWPQPESAFATVMFVFAMVGLGTTASRLVLGRRP